MASFSDYLEGKVLAAVFGQVALPAIATVYLALYTTNPTDAGASGVEVSGGSYARVAVTNNTTNFPAPTGTSPTQTTLHVSFAFPAPTANWGVVTGFAIYDAATLGNELAWGALTASKTINSGDAAPSFAVDALVITLD